MQAYTQANNSGGPYGAQPSTRANWNRGYAGGVPLASWPWRMAAGAIDYLPVGIVASLIAEIHGAAVVGWVIFFAWVLFNSVYMQGTTGQSLGKRIVGIRTAAAVLQNGGQYLIYPGVGRCLWRSIAHIIDIIPFYIGFIRPLWNRQYRTWADSTAKTVVVSREWTDNLERRAPGARRVPGF